MRTKPPNKPDDITSPLHEGQTFNSCPKCHRSWETIPPIKGVIHRTIICEECKADDRYFRTGTRYPGQ
jgi:hypothetical protein